MRQIKLILVSVCILLILSGCAYLAPEVSTSTAVPTTAVPKTSAPTAVPTTAVPKTELSPEDIDLPAEGWYSPVRTRHMGDFGEGGFFSTYKGMLTFTDLSSGTQVVLCSKPGCLHYDEPEKEDRIACDANIPTDRNLFYRNGKLYYISGFDGAYLACRNADGTGDMRIGRIAADYLTKDTTVTPSQFTCTENYLYYRVDVETVVADETGIHNKDFSWLVMRMNLKSGEEELLEEYKLNEGPNLLGARDDMLLYYTKVIKDSGVKVKVWTEDTQQSVTLFSFERQQFRDADYIADGKYYYLRWVEDESNSSTQCYTYDLVTRQHEDLGIQKAPILNGRYAVCKSDTEALDYYLYDTVANSPLPIDIGYSNASIIVVNLGPDGAVWSIMCPGENGTGGLQEHRYVPYSLLEDGLQKTDGIILNIGY